MIFLKTNDEIELLRESNLLVGKTLAELAKVIKPGVTTKDLDKLAINESMKIEIVKQSIKKSWRGFFPLKNDSSGKKQSNDDLAF